MIRVGTDCSGIEAPIQALLKCKIPFKHIFSCEIDKFCIKSIKANYKPDIIYNDITTRDNTKVPDIDIYICGFPCQPFSCAGRRKGVNDKRGNIFLHCLDLIETKLPAVFILENVKGLLSIDKGQTFHNIIESLKALKVYHINYKILNTKDFGIPQNRERLFIVGTLIECDPFYSPISKLTRLKPINNFIDYTDIPMTPSIPQTVIRMKEIIPKDSVFINIAFSKSKHKNSNICPTIMASSTTIWCLPMNRYATVKELLLLQGFPIDFKQVVSNTQIKKQIGNSMSVNVLEYLLNNLF